MITQRDRERWARARQALGVKPCGWCMGTGVQRNKGKLISCRECKGTGEESPNRAISERAPNHCANEAGQ